MMAKTPTALPMVGRAGRRSEGGWELRFVTDARRAEEAAALYRSLGFEVLCEAVMGKGLEGPEVAVTGPDGCDVCFTSEYRTIYTRRVATPRPTTPQPPPPASPTDPE